jgi:hypothetical protein
VGLKDVTGVFSRYFIVGFFLPSFFALIVLSQTVTVHLLPVVYRDHHEDTRVLLVGGAALLLGLLLLGVEFPIIRLFEGYPLLRVRWLGPLVSLLVWGQARAFDRLVKRKELARQGAPAAELDSGLAAWHALDWRFPYRRDRLLPSRFGNAIRASEDYAEQRWGLDAIAAWPRVEPLLSEQEQSLHADAKTDVAFFLNSVLLSVALGVVLIVDEIWHSPLDGSFAWLLYVIPFTVAYVAYRFAVGAGMRWGTEKRASIDLHRLEVYERLGVREPTGFADERKTVAPAVARLLLYGTPISDDLWRQERKEVKS